jgi:hypothetical protein
LGSISRRKQDGGSGDAIPAKQMRYDVFRAKGCSIGSGMVEGACRHVADDPLQAFRNDLESCWLVRYSGLANLWAQRAMEPALPTKPLGRLKTCP